MKKAILVSVIAAAVCGASYASDGGVFIDTQTTTKRVSINAQRTEYTAPAPTRIVVSAQPRPCARAAVTTAPVRVKTYTEVIDHYQVYQPVTILQPIGAYAQRRVVDTIRPCGCSK